MKSYKRPCIFLIAILSYFALSGSITYASSFDKDGSYNVYYEVSNFEVDQVKNVKLYGIKVVEEIAFLVIKKSTSLKDEEGYIRLDTIKAMLPYPLEPRRTFQESGG